MRSAVDRIWRSGRRQHEQENTDVLKAIAVTAELTNTEMSESAFEVFEADLPNTGRSDLVRRPAAGASSAGG